MARKKPIEEPRSSESFTTALWGLMREKYSAGPFDAPTISQLVRDLGDDWHYENVRKILAGERGLPLNFMVDCARIFGVTPQYFREYRRHEVEAAIRRHPDILSEIYDLVIDLDARYEELDSASQKVGKSVESPSVGGSGE